jgi:2-hydroxy-3-keto-5-methylthiopentenyl-1-phosphate phosphatase
MFQHFGNGNQCNQYFSEYLSGGIDAKECWRRSCQTVPAIEQSQFTGFAMEQDIDSSFSSFTRFCSEREVPVIVLSDGFDSYIDPILSKNGLQHLKRYSNSLQFIDSKVIPVFPHSDESCIQCANCKRNHILTHASDTQVIVYIGDGYSDRCPVRFADIVFAKNSLLKYCEANNITYFRFKTFTDVENKFKEIIEKQKPKKRLMAEHARKEVYLQG